MRAARGSEKSCPPSTPSPAARRAPHTASDIKGAKRTRCLRDRLQRRRRLGHLDRQRIPESGKYTCTSATACPQGRNGTLTVNGTAASTPVDMKNYANAPEGDYEKGWTRTYNYVQLNKGTNTIKISCEQGNQCDANLDQVWLVKGWVE
ncbi:hypothetical protein [Streptomyces sp. F001]|uniref:hypothetical protein n=1 Tax=Streptomyces sp. F001 TaxID=1510026 RepID=UPI0032089B87